MEKKKLNICLMNDSFPPTIDGVATTVLNYAENISGGLGRCTVVTPEWPGVKDEYPGFEVLRYPSMDTVDMVGYRLGNPFDPDTLDKIASMDFDILHTHCPFASNVQARLLRQRIHKPVIFTYHTKFDVEIEKAIKLGVLQKEAAKALVDNISSCDEVWVVSKGAGDNLRKLGYKGDYIVMPNGCDLSRGRVSEEVLDSLRAQYDIPQSQDTPVYLFVGRAMWYKGIRIILDGLKKLADDGQKFIMVFVGDSAELPEIKEYASNLGLDAYCRFIGPVHDREMIRAWYCMGDLLLFPSTFDTNGLVVREAAACSVPALLVKDSCAAEGIEDGFTGLLIEENAESLYEKLKESGLNKEYLHTIGVNAAENIYISWKDSVANAYHRYEEIMEKWNYGGFGEKEKSSDDLFNFFYNISENNRKAALKREAFKTKSGQAINQLTDKAEAMISKAGAVFDEAEEKWKRLITKPEHSSETEKVFDDAADWDKSEELRQKEIQNLMKQAGKVEDFFDRWL